MIVVASRVAGSAEEAEAIVRALSEGRARLIPRPAEAVPVPAPTADCEPCQQGTAADRIREAVRRLIATGQPFGTRQVCDVLGYGGKNIIRVLAGFVMDGEVVELDHGDARRGPITDGHEGRARKWLPVRP